ncbi:MAG: transposase [Candidatus Omnitrophica bacterium]|nr:transposase [Candidatus Omnitrophota bacterium]
MSNKELVFRLRKRVFDDWRSKMLRWYEVKEKYGFSKKWFYKWRARYVKYGVEGLRDMPKKKPSMPHSLGQDIKLKILDYILENPTHGPGRISMELDVKVSHQAVWEYLVKENLNTRRKRRYWAEDHGKLVLTNKEKLVRQAKHNHIESSKPGELLCMDTFWCNVKSVGRVWQYTACDAHSSFGWAKLYLERISENSVDFVENHILRTVPEGKIKRILTDQGSEFYAHNAKYVTHHFKDNLDRLGIKHSITKVAHPWTNGYAERLNQTIWQEFYLCRLSRPFSSLEALNEELRDFMRHYNFRRKHTGYKLRDNGYCYPYQAFFEIPEKIVALV